MLILEAALTAILALHGATVKAPSRRIQPVILALNDSELARAIKADLESISGRDTVDVTVDSRTLVTVRVETPALSSETYRRIFDRELEFYRAFPDLNFDFYVRSGPAGPVASK